MSSVRICYRYLKTSFVDRFWSETAHWKWTLRCLVMLKRSSGSEKQLSPMQISGSGVGDKNDRPALTVPCSFFSEQMSSLSRLPGIFTVKTDKVGCYRRSVFFRRF